MGNIYCDELIHNNENEEHLFNKKHLNPNLISDEKLINQILEMPVSFVAEVGDYEISA
jgi:hypothetical protein